MAHFRGQIRGPHWGPTLDNMLIDFWRRQECLFNSSLESYYDKDLKTKLWSEFAVSIGKPVSDVERRSRSLRTQYGRVLWHPERINTLQKKMLKEKLDFLRPYIVRRRSDSYLDDKFDDGEEDDEDLEIGHCDQKMGSTLGNPLDADVAGQDLHDEPLPVASTASLASLHCASPCPHITESISLSCDCHDAGPPDQPDQTQVPLNIPKHDILNQFAEVMLADMQQIKNPVVQMRLRRDITNLVFRAVEEDLQSQYGHWSSVSSFGESAQLQSYSRPQETCSQSGSFWRQTFLKRKLKRSEVERRLHRQEEVKRMRVHPVHEGGAVDLISESCSQPELKLDPELHVIKTEEVLDAGVSVLPD
ncbi:uncharacterized protein LOC117524761 [Thalassophryne amazonica]|uniref:uncharacterized protein LOC117524761 n=1 Tax=Thalassophryne amazonica TaxID=390379 RepID=UPI001470A922|nr:uncharacterized protein LOC117524761 [Thalassophryne amazonica]